MVVDSQSYSDLEPMQAHLWSMQIELANNSKGPQLSQLLASLCKLSTEHLSPCKYYFIVLLCHLEFMFTDQLFTDSVF